MLILILLLLVVLFLFVFPVAEKPIDFDEKGEAIKVYKDEVSHLERQLEKGFIDVSEKNQLLAELDKKSALAISAIEKRRYTYRRSWVSMVLVVAGLAASSLLYFYHYQNSGVQRWQAFNKVNHGAITEGLFDRRVVEQFLQQSDAKTAGAYCFAMQQQLLKKYDTNPDTLANLAQCHIAVGYPTLAAEAAERGLKTQPEHAALNYLMAEADFIENKRLSPAALDHLMTTIKQDPDHFNALRLLAVNSLSQGDYQQARFFFSHLKKQAKNNPKLLANLEKMDKDIAKRIAAKNTAQAANSKATENTPEAPPNTNNSTNTEATQKTPAANTVSLRLSINLTSDIAAKLKGPQTLFVVVKSAQGQLLNATKHSMSDFSQPLNVTITDNQAGAMQRQPMAGQQSVAVVARLTQSGSPMASSGDMTSQPIVINLPQAAVAHVLIDSLVP